VEYVYIVILLALMEYVALTALVGRARAKYGVRAPATTGPPEFERTFRVQQNTLEGLIVLLPGLWLFGTYVDAMIAAVLGLLAILGRAAYAKGYIEAAEKRAVGALVCGFVNIALVIGGLGGVVVAVLR